MKKFKKTIKIIVPSITAIIAIIIGIFIIYGNSPQKYLDAANLGGQYLLEHLNNNGVYVYNYNPIKNKASSSYNILRHAGTTYSLLELYEVTKNTEILNKAEKALNYLVNASLPCPNFKEALCLTEKEEVKLGGNGLAILAMAKYSQVTNSQKYIPTAQKLAKYIVQTQSKEGEFTIQKMNINDGIADNFNSMYYPGEAIFGLSKLYQIDHNEKWITAAHKGAHWLIEVRDKEKSINELDHDHWLLYGLNELHQNKPEKLYVEHAKKIVDAILSIQHKNETGDRADWNGGYYTPPRSTPTATRSEGLEAAYQIFQRTNETKYAKKTLAAIKAGLEFQLRTQMTTKKIKKLKANPQALGGFSESLTKYSIRIDYVQHNISALLGYLKIMSSLSR